MLKPTLEWLQMANVTVRLVSPILWKARVTDLLRELNKFLGALGRLMATHYNLPPPPK